MATLTFEEGTYTDTTIISNDPTATNTSNSGVILKNSGGVQSSAIFVFVRPNTNPRFIPEAAKVVSGDGSNTHHILVRSTANASAVANCVVCETLAVTPIADSTTYNQYTSKLSWTTAGGRDDVKPNTTSTNGLPVTSSGGFFGIPLGYSQVGSMLKTETTSILISAIEVCAVNFRLEEVGSASLRPDLVIKGRYATRNREATFRSRKFGVR